MLKKPLTLLALLLAAFAAQAQSTPAKTELAAKIVTLQLPGIEVMARSLAEQPAAEMMSRVGPVLAARVEPEKRAAVAREIQADVKKYLDQAVPLVRERALNLAPTTVGPFLEGKLSEDELRQVIAVMESPAWIKFQQLAAEMQKVLQDKLVADTRATIEPKLRALDQSIGRRLGVTAPAAKAAAKPASAPAK